MLFGSIAMAQPGQPGAGGLGLFIPMLAIFAIFYFLILRPQSKRQKEHESMLNKLEKGDHIVTSGGIHGVIQRVNEKEGTLIVKVSDDVKIEVDRNAVARKIVSEASAKD
jgi:preprotein translocase subunit YajC